MLNKKLYFALLLFILAVNFNASAQLKGDPWIFKVYKELWGIQPNAWELNIKNYNGGSWNSYAELKKYVSQYQNSMTTQGLTVSVKNISDVNFAVVFNQNGRSIAVDLITNDGGTIKVAGAGNIALISGANLLANAGIVVNANLAGATFGSRYTLQSEGTKVIQTSGKGALIIH